MRKGLEKTQPKRRPAPTASRRATPVVAAAVAPDADPPATQPAATAMRGEHELTLAGVPYRLRPSRQAIIAIEAKTGCSMIELVRAGNAGALGLVQLGTIAAELIHAGAEDDVTRMISAERVQELIYEQGVGRPAAALTMCLLDAANGGRTAAGNAKAAAG